MMMIARTSNCPVARVRLDLLLAVTGFLAHSLAHGTPCAPDRTRVPSAVSIRRCTGRAFNERRKR